MPDLEKLIQYWKGRLEEHPPLASLDWKEAVEATVAYLEELKIRKAVK